MYKIFFSEKAKLGLSKLKKEAPYLLKKLEKLLIEIEQHPTTGTGQVEQLKYLGTNTYSRRINRKHRVVYRVLDDVVEVIIISVFGHYE
ncbi:MAG: Txe/YoeB family addiction module toxin [Muribaculaceae bacterium]|nr:Txe/YoeB family addiction module toxin [Muribaculaceae bacterium]MBQ2562568.1 Txe/YoeB family addiction module toxin [Muribaculaceae bacterium]MDY6293609.1 Txe/YoeB family addiction module toxin [Bacteroidales bacterium]MDY6412757.1 Txe/YoeB family addiction module toxin [Bacteroidales bacterium]